LRGVEAACYASEFRGIEAQIVFARHAANFLLFINGNLPHSAQGSGSATVKEVAIESAYLLDDIFARVRTLQQWRKQIAVPTPVEIRQVIQQLSVTHIVFRRVLRSGQTRVQ
jgi:hypothetical protein